MDKCRNESSSTASSAAGQLGKITTIDVTTMVIQFASAVDDDYDEGKVGSQKQFVAALFPLQ